MKTAGAVTKRRAAMLRLLFSLALGLLSARLHAADPLPTARPFGKLPDGRTAQLFTLRAADGFTAEITDYGGIIVRLLAPDRAGQLADVTLGYSEVAGYAAKSPYFGAIIGRVGNRIAGGKFTLDGKTCTLATNNSPGGIPCHLHGGVAGFDKELWAAEPLVREGRAALRLSLASPAGEEGYPGTLRIEVLYSLTADRGLRIDYTATTDAPTPVNLTNHAYFNLRGEGRGDILGHVLELRAQRYTPVNAGLIPTGELAPVAGTPFDFTKPQAIGARIGQKHEQLERGLGYDHNFVLADAPRREPTLAARVREPTTGRVLEVLTTEPGVQLYTGNFLDGTITGKSGRPYAQRDGFCLETQHFPDAVNQPGFPSTIVRPGQVYRSATVYRFSTE
ncbi:MAG: aldose epimerase family protein [Opitutaceae bacterium]|nr:aldose epimerase family protein [Opitutaceae bacterium]